jgi:hypothetical protein
LSLEAQAKLEKDTAKKEAKAEAKADAALKKKLASAVGLDSYCKILPLTSPVDYDQTNRTN